MSRDAVESVIWERQLAEIYAWVGEGEAALDELEKLVKLPGGHNYGELLFDPVWDSIRETSRFKEIIAEAARPLEYQ